MLCSSSARAQAPFEIAFPLPQYDRQFFDETFLHRQHCAFPSVSQVRKQKNLKIVTIFKEATCSIAP